jgi:hypothetical protein
MRAYESNRRSLLAAPLIAAVAHEDASGVAATCSPPAPIQRAENNQVTA